IVAYLNWEYNQKFDAQHIRADELYRVNFYRITNGRPVSNGSCPMPLGDAVRGALPQVEQVIRYFPDGGNFKVGNEVFATSVAGVDPEFFDAFTFEMVVGDASAISDKSRILISSELQQRHFPGNTNPVGEVLTYVSGEERQEFVVAGVFAKPPQNSSFGDQAFVRYDNLMDMNGWQGNEWQLFNTTFLRIPDPAAVPAVESALAGYVDIQNTNKPDYKVDRFYLDPFKGMAVRAEKSDTWNHWTRDSLPLAAASAPGIMALLILLIACFNFTNTSIAIANRRIREIGVRKVLGSSKRQLVTQFLGENLLLTFLALLAGLGIAAILVPAYSRMWAFLDIQLDLFSNPQLLMFLAGLLTFTALVAGSYPALYVSSFQPTAIFRGSVKFSGTNALTRILLTLQFAISLIAIICGVVFAQNAQYQSRYDLGFDLDNVVYAYVKNERGFNNMRDAIQDYQGIDEIAGSRHNVTASWYTDPVRVGSTELDVDLLDVGADYLSAIGGTLTAGRNFREGSVTDAETSVIVNEEMVRQFGWDDPIDQRIVLRDTVALNVVGVVRDIYVDGALWDPLSPMLMRYALPAQYRYLTVRTAPGALSTVKAQMDAAWKQIFPDELPNVRVMDQERAQMLEVNTNIKTLFLFLGLVAVLLSVIGLF
ncbi:MAG: ABC transporter permease, partial [Saprospiraceae bacterium]|nr:ABC transporter permease [Saprospiraceae bacterium]